jgi:cytochrome P450
MNEAAAAVRPPEERLPPELVRRYDLSSLSSAEEDPFEVLIPRMHQGPSLFYDPKGALMGRGAWIFRREKDIRAAFRDDEHFGSSGAVDVLKIIGIEGGLIPAEIDPPQHSLYRTLLNPLFSPRRMTSLDDVVEKEAARLLDLLRDKGECDFINDFAVPLPVGIFLSLLGLSLDELDTYVRWEKTIFATKDIELKKATLRALAECLEAAMQERMKHPRDDALTCLATGEVDGRRLNASERMRTAMMLYFAGLDTVTSMMAWHVKYLAEHPEDQEQLRKSPELVPAATEEMLRAFAVLTVNKRCSKKWVSEDGIVIEPGERVLLPTPLANRDPEAYPEPNRIVFDRNPSHSAFALGIHRCIGSHLARRELQISLRLLVEKLPPFRRKDDARLPVRFGSVLGLGELPIVWED